jgi:hypothetical protein
MLGVPGFALALRWFPGRASHAVALPVSVRVWKMWRSRNLAGLSVMTAGTTFAAIGLATEVTGLVVFGCLMLVAGTAYRTRAHHNYWVTCRFRPVDSTIVVEPTHPRFDEQARELFIRSMR